MEGGGDWCSAGSGVKLGTIIFINVIIFVIIVIIVIVMNMKETGILIGQTVE